MKLEFKVKGRMPGLNEYTQACRLNPYSGAEMKRIAQETVEWVVKQRKADQFQSPVTIIYNFYEKDQRRDKSNIAAFAVKVIEDALVKQGVLKDDGWKYIDGFEEHFFVDKDDPRIEVIVKDNEE